MTTTVIHISLAMAAKREDKIGPNFTSKVSFSTTVTSPVSTSR